MQRNHSDEAFLPAFCSPIAVFVVVLVGELLAVFMALSVSQLPAFNWQMLGAASLFVQWVGLSAAAILCAVKPRVERWSLRAQVVLVYVVVLVVTSAYSLLASGLLHSGGAPWWAALKALLLSAIVVGIGLRYFVLQYLHQQQKQAELQSRIEVLQARIRPHFMFNTLNAIASMIHVDQAKAEVMTLDFADLMRSAMQQPALVPLASELALCRQYVALEQLRFGDKLQVEWHIDAASEQARVPNLLLQPLIENAIYHGIQGRSAGGTIIVRCQLNDAAMRLSVSNPKADSNFQPQHGQQFAVENIRHRLQLVYGDAAALSQIDGDDFTVALSLPLELTS